jgi:hypothetical protein
MGACHTQVSHIETADLSTCRPPTCRYFCRTIHADAALTKRVIDYEDYQDILAHPKNQQHDNPTLYVAYCLPVGTGQGHEPISTLL